MGISGGIFAEIGSLGVKGTEGESEVVPEVYGELRKN